MTSRRDFFKVVAATAAVLIVPTGGIRLLRTHLARGDVRELIQYNVNLDEFIYRCDVLFPHPAGVLLRYARHPTDTMIQFNTITPVRYDVAIGSKAFHAAYRLAAYWALEAAMTEHGIGVYDLVTYLLPVPRGVDSPEDWVARQDYDAKRSLMHDARGARPALSRGDASAMALPQPPFTDASIRVS